MASSATMSVEVAVPPQQAEAAVYQAFVDVGLKGVNGGSGMMHGVFTTSFWSWGETMTATISHGPRGSTVQVRSASALPTAVIDFGRNKKNVTKVLDALRAHVPVV